MKKHILVVAIVVLTALFSNDLPRALARADVNEIIFYGQPASGLPSQIYSIDSEGTGQLIVGNDPVTWNSYPSWAPDGSKIIYSRNGDIWTMDPLGLNSIKLTGGGAGGAVNPVSSPNGDSVAYIYDGHGFQAASILVFSLKSGLVSLTDIGPHDSSEIRWDYGIAWSPDGSKIAFTRVENDKRRSNIYVINADGTGEIALTQSADLEFNMDPSWSPDGSKIVFCSPNGISVMNADGSNRNQIAELTGGSRHPAWSPDGSEIVFSAKTGGESFLNIHKMKSDGSDIVRITQNTFDSLGPKWKPSTKVSISGRLITPNGTGLRNAVVMLVDDSGNRRTTVTSTLGYYSFSDIRFGETVTISAQSRRYRFQHVTRALNETLAEIDLVGIE